MTKIVEEDNKVNKLSENFENQGDNCDKKSKKLKNKKNDGSKKKKRKLENEENFENQPEVKKNKENLEVNHKREIMETCQVPDPSPPKDPTTSEVLSDPEDLDEPEALTSEDQQLTVKYFRNSFTSPNAFGALRKFVALGSTSPAQILGDYLDSGGNVMEILRLLDGLDKKRLNDVALIFTASALVIMRTIATHPQQQPSTIQACRFILNTHISLLRSLMSKSVFPRQRKSALKLLTSMVMLGDSLPRDILTHLTFDRETTSLLAKQTKPSDPESVRVCFINFLLAFLIDTEPWTVRCLVDKSELLASIFPELTFDRANLVHLVLNVLKKYLLENPAVSKTQKHHLFSVPVIESIVQLYNYRGPRSWSDSRRKNQGPTDPSVDDKETVVSATHEFLLTLLTSAKHGIIFRDQNLGTRKDHNSRVARVIQNLDKPWNHSRPRELVTRILGSCPDLVKLVLGTSEPFFEPRPNKNWTNLVSFYRDILALSLDSIQTTLVTLNVQQCVSVTLTLAAPASVLRAVGPSITSEHLVVRFQGLLTLGAMLKKVRKFFAVIDDHFSEQNAESYRVSIQNYLAKHLPKVGEVLRAWNELRNSLGEPLDQQFLPQEPKEYLDAVLSLLENYRECNQEPGGRLDCDSDAENPDLGTKLRVIEVNYWLDPKAYEVKEKLFSSSLTFLVESLEGSENLVGTLKTVLGPLKPFQKCPEHLDIWIQAMGWISKDKRAGLAKWVVNLLRKMFKCPEKFANVLKDVEKALKWEKELEIGVPMVFVAAVSSLKENFDDTVNVFLGYVTILTLHSLRDPRVLAKLVENTDLMTKYLKGWLDGEVRKLKDFPCELMSSVSKYLLSKKDISLETLESLEVSTEIEKENLFYMILFYFTNSVKANQETGARKCKVALLWILKLMKSSEDVPEGNTRVQKRFRMFAKHFAEHPVVLKNFSFIATENFAETFISKECFDIFAMIPVFDFYRDKVISDLWRAIDGKFTDNIIDKIEYFDILDISGQEISELLSRILELKSSKFYEKELTILGRLVSKLLKIRATISLDYGYANFVINFWRHLGKLKAKKIDTSAWESAMLMFVDDDEVVIDIKQFKTLLTDLRGSTIALINRLVKQNPTLMAPLSQFLLSQYKKPEILFPLMEPNLEKLKPQLLTTIFENYAPEILDYFNEVTNPWIEQFPLAVQFLISKKFTKEQCQQVADKLLESREKLERINSSYLALVSVVWEKRAEFESPIETVEEYLQILLPIAVSALKKAKKDGERLDAVTSCMMKALDKLEKLKSEGYLFEKIVRNNAFKQLVNYSLKHGLKVDVPSGSLVRDKVMPPLDSLEAMLKLDDAKETPVAFSIVDVLSKLLNVAYSDSTSDIYAEQIYDMMRTNSNFEDVLLSKSTTKVSLLRLFLTMTRKVPGKIESEDLKLLMRAYEATLNPGDQLILMILQFYESRGLYLETGLLWGRGATNHTGGDVDTNLWRQITASQTLELLDPEIVARTVKFYPIDRGLRATEVLEFESEIYDPAFYLPLMVTLSTADKLLPTNKLVKSGAMALVLSSCASNHADVRLAAFTALSQFYYHFDAAKNKDKMIWLRCIDALRNGVAQLMGPEAKLETLRLSSLITTFLARTSLISAKDGNVMFAPIQGYFMAKQALDLKVVPEFLTLFHSSDVNHKSYRHWMLECVRDGIKSYYDVKLALKMSIYKIIMDFYGSVLADQDTKALTLQIIEATVKIPQASIILIKEYSLFNWLHELAPKIDQRNRQVVDTLVNILKHLSRSRLETTDKALKDHAEFMIQMIVKARN